MPRYRSTGGLDDPRIEDGDVGFIGVNVRLPSWQLPAGMLSLSENGRIEGDWRPRKGAVVLTEGSIAEGSPLRVPFWAIDTSGGLAITAASRVGEVVTLTVTAHGLNPIGEAAYLRVAGLGFATVDPNSTWLVTATDANTLTYSIDGAVGSETYTIGGGDDKVLSVLDDSEGAGVLASCVFSDPSSENAESVFMAFGGSVKAVALDGGVITEYGLPVGETLDGEINMIQSFDRVYIFRAGKIAMEWQVGDTDFALVANGVYAQPQILTSSGAAISAADGLVSFAVVGNTTIAVGDLIKIYTSSDVRFTEFIGQQFQVASATSTLVTAYIPVPDSASGSNSVQIGKPISLGAGFIYQPGFPWAVPFQRRLWGPYRYSWDVSLSPDAFSDRDIRDEIIASDILDGDTYDAIENQYRITAGMADYVVGLHPFFDDSLLVFNRNSIHGVFGTSGSLLDTSVKELTREIGCLARKSIATQGNSIFFLSDNGVYGLAFADQYNLRGVERPLSEAIQPYIDRISRELASEAIGAYFDNRYWLAVPLDSAAGQGDATGNNAIFVYNLLNREWESVDTFGDPNFMITNLLIGAAGSRNSLYAVTGGGGVHELNSLDEDYDYIATNPVSGPHQYGIAAVMGTRSYMCGSTDRKRFCDYGVSMKSAGWGQSDFGIAIATDDPDNQAGEVLASSLNGGIIAANDTADIRGRVGGLRGFNGAITIRRVLGRPSIRSTRISATVTNRATLTQN